MTGPKILVFDIETAPMISYMWRMWKETIGINQIESDWYILCWCAKWVGEKKIHKAALPDFPTYYKKHPESDKAILAPLWDLINEADILVTHNGNRFDIPKTNSRFLVNGMNPPAPSKSVDTYQIARHKFGFTSNKLDYIGQHLGLGKKKETGGFKLWRDCLKGDPTAWKKMVRYNMQDVNLLEKVYIKLRPWARTHPVFSLYCDDEEIRCHRCGSTNLSPNGSVMTAAGQYKRYHCNDCGAWPRGRVNMLAGKAGKPKRENTLINIV